jgi:hypothetical protein
LHLHWKILGCNWLKFFQTTGDPYYLRATRLNSECLTGVFVAAPDALLVPASAVSVNNSDKVEACICKEKLIALTVVVETITLLLYIQEVLISFLDL